MESTEIPASERGKNVIPLLPDLKEKGNRHLFDVFAMLNLEKEIKDSIHTWWTTNQQTLNNLQELAKTANSPALPENEAREIKSVYKRSLEAVKNINEGISDIIKKKPSSLARTVSVLLATLTAETPGYETAAYSLADQIKAFGLNVEAPSMGFALSVGKAIVETREQNPDPELLRKKVAQQAFEEMIHQLAYSRTVYKGDLDVEVSPIIDDPQTEKSELTAALKSKPWSGEKRRKMLRNYNKLRRVLINVGADTEYKVGFNTLWKWANGEIPQGSSVFSILDKVNYLDEGITESLSDAWDVELERESDDEEAEDE